ncbi:MAG: hypothetical protein OEZ33_10815, partial [Gammaproteobacteria bacterium]|nr:hypothetical protein [Gammaproteobacteria bacterium]
AYVRPMFIVNYAAGDGVADVDLISFDRVANSADLLQSGNWADLPASGADVTANNIALNTSNVGDVSAADAEASILGQFLEVYNGSSGEQLPDGQFKAHLNIANNSAATEWFKIGQFHLNGNYNNISVSGIINWGGTAARSYQSSRIHAIFSVNTDHTTLSYSELNYSGDANLEDYLQFRTEIVSGKTYVYMYAKLTAYKQIIADLIWSKNGSKVVADTWINQAQENTADGLGATDPGNTTHGWSRNYEIGATLGADWQINIDNQPLNLASLTGLEAILNGDISIGADGLLAGAGGGQVTLPGIGFTGDTNATYNIGALADLNTISWDLHIPDIPANLDVLNGDESLDNEAVSYDNYAPIAYNNQYDFNGTSYQSIGEKIAIADIGLKVGDTITCSADVWSDNGQNLRASIRFHDATTYLSRQESSGSAATQPTRLYVTATIPANTVYIDFGADNPSYTTGSGISNQHWRRGHLYKGSANLPYAPARDIGAKARADWTTDVDFRPDNLVALGGAESIQNSQIQLNPDGSLYDNESATSLGALTIWTLGFLGDLDADITKENQFVSRHSWSFRNSLAGWTFTDLTTTLNAERIVATSTSADPKITLAGLSINGLLQNKVLVRMKLNGASWQGDLYYTTGTHGYSASYRKNVAKPTSGQWVTLVFDMQDLTAGGTDWVSNTITGLRFDFNTVIGDSVEIAWIAVGNYAADPLLENEIEFGANVTETRTSLNTSNVGAIAATDVDGTILSAGKLVTSVGIQQVAGSSI